MDFLALLVAAKAPRKACMIGGRRRDAKGTVAKVARLCGDKVRGKRLD